MLNSVISWYLENLLTLEIISLFISFILLIFIVYYIVKLNFIREEINEFKDFFGKTDISRRRSLRAWKQIQKRLETGNDTQLKLAVIEADRILDEILKKSGYKGKTMDERLGQVIPAQLSNIREIRQVHRIRNRIVAEPDFLISDGEAKVIVEIYKKAFQEFGLID